MTSVVFVATERIVGRGAPPCAKRRLGNGFGIAEVVLVALQVGFTVRAGITFTSWPAASSRRLRWCAPTAGGYTPEHGRSIPTADVGYRLGDRSTRRLVGAHRTAQSRSREQTRGIERRQR